MPVRDPADPFSIQAGFDRLLGWPGWPDMLGAYTRAAFAARRAFLPLPFEGRRRKREPVLPPFSPLPGQPLAGKRIGLVVSGGSGNLSTTCGVVRAIEEAGGDIVAVSGCSGGALWAAQVGLGFSGDEMASFSLGDLDPASYLDLQPVRQALRSVARRRTLAGLMNGGAVQALFDGQAAGRALAELPRAFYGILWEIETNRVLYAGPKTTPDWSLGEIVRSAISLAPVVQPYERDGRHYVDGGVIDVMPVRPLLEHHPEIDAFVAINGFLPRGLQGPDLHGWHKRTNGLLTVARQLQLAQHEELARREWETIADRAWLVEPITDIQAYGINFFAAMVDRSVWPDRIRAGHAAARAVLAAPIGTRTADLLGATPGLGS